MQYILTETELRELKENAELKGFRRAEKVLDDVLGGIRQIMVSSSGSYGDPGWKPPQPISSDTPWARLIERLDEQDEGEK